MDEERARKEEEELERKRRKADDMKEEFEEYQRVRWKGRRVRAHFHKAEATLAQLEKREVVPEPKKEGGDEAENEEEEEQIITEEVSSTIIVHVFYHLGVVSNMMQAENEMVIYSAILWQFHQLSRVNKTFFRLNKIQTPPI